MIKRNLVIFCMLIASCHASLTYKGIPEENYIEEGKKFPAVCKAFLFGKEGNPRYGSGTLCEDNKGRKFILTAAHVVDNIDLNCQVKDWLFINGFLGSISTIKIFDHYHNPGNVIKNYLDVALVFLDKYPDNIKPMKIGIPDLKEGEERIVKGVGYGLSGIYDHTGRGHYTSLQSSYISKAIELNVKRDSRFSCSLRFNFNQDFSSLEKVFKSNLSLALEGAFSNGGSGGPILYNNEIIALICGGAKDMIHLENRDEGAPIYRALTNSRLRNACVTIESFIIPSHKMYFRHAAKWFFDLPDFSINAFQTMTLLTPKIQEWIYKTVDEVNR